MSSVLNAHFLARIAARSFIVSATGAALLFLLSGTGLAQSVPSAADPGRIGAPIPREIDRPTTVQNMPQEPATAELVLPGADSVVVAISTIVWDGPPPPGWISAADLLGPRLGEKVPFQAVLDTLNTYLRRHRADGYIFSRIVLPPQDISDGTLHLVYVPAVITDVAMPDNPRLATTPEVADAIARLKGSPVFNVFDVERALLLLNDLPGYRVQSVLRPGTAEAGSSVPIAIDLVATAADPDRRVAVDNHGSLFLGPWQASVIAPFADVLRPFDRLDLQVLTSVPADELSFVDIAYQRPILGLSGTMLRVGTNWGKTAAGDSLAELDVLGLTRELRAGVTYPVIRSRRDNLFVSSSVVAKNTRSKLLGDEVYDDRLRYVEAGVSYDRLDSYDGLSFISATIAQGFNGLGARETGSFNLSRTGGRSDFTKIGFTASRMQNLGRDFLIIAEVSGQYAFTPLLSAMEFGLGGSGNARGYDPSEIAGDHGFAAGIEARYRGVPDVSRLSIQPYVFLQGGMVWDKSGSDADDTARQSLISTGAGVRLAHESGWVSDAALALPLTNPADNPAGYTNPEGPRVLFSLSRKF